MRSQIVFHIHSNNAECSCHMIRHEEQGNGIEEQEIQAHSYSHLPF